MKEMICFQCVACYDNGGKTADRFTVVFLDQSERGENTFAALGMNHEPFHPMGIGMHVTAMDGPHLGEPIPFEDLPADCQRCAMQDLKSTQVSAYFNRFCLSMLPEAVRDCHHQGQCDADVECWASKVNRPADCTPEALRAELEEYGAWDAEELADDDQNWRRIVWIAAGNIQEETHEREREFERESETAAA